LFVYFAERNSTVFRPNQGGQSSVLFPVGLGQKWLPLTSAETRIRPGGVGKENLFAKIVAKSFTDGTKDR
jgi:hypothetical protein